MSFFLYLNSHDSIHPSPNYELYFVINSTMGLDHLARFQISLQDVEFVNAVYPINEYNNKLYWFQSSTSSYITAYVTPGFYNGTTLASQVASAMTTASGTRTYTCTYNSDMKKYTISVDSSTWYPDFNATYLLWDNIGYGAAFASASITSAYPIMISGTNYVDLITSINTKSISTTTTENVLCRVPISTAFSEIVYYEPTSANTIIVELNALKELNLKLRDDHGNPWKLPANAHISITLKITPL